MRLVTLTAAALLLAAPMLRADDRKSPPDADAQAKAEALIKDLFKDDFAKKKPADMAALASKLLQQAAETKNDPAAEFVLLRLAADTAGKAGDAGDALQAIDALAHDFAVSTAALKAQALDAAVHATGGATVDYQAVLDAALPAADEAQTADDYDSESRLLRAAQIAAQKLDKKQTAAVAGERGKLLDAIQNEYGAVKKDLDTLKEKPDDPDASLHVGRFWCFYKGDWDRGLPLLAVGGDAKLKALAKKEIVGPTVAAGQAALADAWMDAAGGEAGVRVEQIELHACAWYKQAAPQLTGLDKAKVEKKIKDLDKVSEKLAFSDEKDAPPEPGWFVLFRSLDPRIWDNDFNGGKNAFAIPLLKAPDGVQYLKMTRTDTNGYVIIPMTNAALKRRTDDGVIGWNGEDRMSWHGYHLGIYFAAVKDIVKGEVLTADTGIGQGSTGWGFGHRAHQDDVQGYAWNGQPMLPTVIEIAVKPGPLTEAEAKHLVGRKGK